MNMPGKGDNLDDSNRSNVRQDTTSSTGSNRGQSRSRTNRDPNSSRHQRNRSRTEISHSSHQGGGAPPSRHSRSRGSGGRATRRRSSSAGAISRLGQGLSRLPESTLPNPYGNRLDNSESEMDRSATRPLGRASTVSIASRTSTSAYGHTTDEDIPLSRSSTAHTIGASRRSQMRRSSSAGSLTSFAIAGGIQEAYSSALGGSRTNDDSDAFDDSVLQTHKLDEEKPQKNRMGTDDSIFARRGEKDLRTVDQSVNLMDVEACAKYASPDKTEEEKQNKRPSYLQWFGAHKSSLHDIDLGPDPSKRRSASLKMRQKALSKKAVLTNTLSDTVGAKVKPIFRVICSVPFLTTIWIVLALVFGIPYLQETVNRLGATN